jgi:hypothetical protein
MPLPIYPFGDFNVSTVRTRPKTIGAFVHIFEQAFGSIIFHQPRGFSMWDGISDPIYSGKEESSIACAFVLSLVRSTK